MRKILVGALALLAILVAVPASAQAAGVQPLAFSQTCHLTVSTDARVDTPAIVTSSGRSRVDSDSLRFRALRRSDGTLSTARFERVRAELRQEDGVWVKWSERGGTATDGALVGPDYSWDPGAKASVTHTYLYFRFQATYSNGTSYCYTTPVSF